jgi:hypothetical protein
MELYSVILFLHIVSGMGMAAALATMITYEVRGRGAKTPGELRSVYDTQLRMSMRMKMLALVLGTSGLYMAHAHWSIASAWVIEAIVIFVYLLSTGPLVFGRRMHAAVEAAERAGMIDAEVHTILDDPILATLGRLRVALLALLVFLMTIKPGVAGALAALATAIAVGVTSGAVAKREMRESPEARSKAA